MHKIRDHVSEKSVYTQLNRYEVVDGVLRMLPNSSVIPNSESVEREEVLLWDNEELVENNRELLRNNGELLTISGELLGNDGEMPRNEELLKRNEELLRRNEHLLRRNEHFLRFIEEVTELYEEEEEARKLLSEEEEARKLLSEEEEARKLLSDEEEARKLLSEEEEARKLLSEEEEVTEQVEVIVRKGSNCGYCGIFMRNDKKFENHVYGKRCQELKKVIKYEAKKRKVSEEEVMKGIIINDKRYPCYRCDFVCSSKEELGVHLNKECKAAKNQHGTGAGPSRA